MTELTQAERAKELGFWPATAKGWTWTWQRCGRYDYRKCLTHLTNPDHLVPGGPSPTNVLPSGSPPSMPPRGPELGGADNSTSTHCLAALQLSSRVDFMQVSKWLGHSTFTLTLDVYGDYIPEEDGGALNTLPEPPAPKQPALGTIVPFRRQSS